MATKIEKMLAEEVLAGDSRTPSLHLLQQGLLSFYGVRKAFFGIFDFERYDMNGSARRLRVRCNLRRGSKLILYVGPRIWYDRSIFLSRDPDTGLTKRLKRNDRKVDKTIVEIVTAGGSSQRFQNWPRAASALAQKCGGSASSVERVCTAIERARKRCLELIEETTRWR